LALPIIWLAFTALYSVGQQHVTGQYLLPALRQIAEGYCMISLKRQRELIQEMRDFQRVYNEALSYGQAGDGKTAKFLINSFKFGKQSPEEREWMDRQMHEAGMRLLKRQHEQLMRGLPLLPHRPRKPTLQ
jgi:hypothetical protein